MSPETIINFWFAESAKDFWFNSTPELDRQLRDRFIDTWLAAAENKFADWEQSPEGALALAIVLDQFPLNIFRGKPLTFSTEAQARKICRAAIEKGFDKKLTDEQKCFIYMPFMHSEDMADQDSSIKFFDQPGLEESLRFAHHHRDIVQRFGRFPHRNELLGRHSTQDEIDYLASPEGFHG
ncbi:MAG TPA: DUF924 domain-containing protein [Ectothiorhodospiraceae bacterium]|nr:DUF924 domain-containing protein [Ectothiorhodospiraceae bacterium]